MSADRDSSEQGPINRRDVLASIAAASGVGLAGCGGGTTGGGGDGGGSGELGERVPTQVFRIFADHDNTGTFETMGEITKSDLSEIGIEVELDPAETSASWNCMVYEERCYHWVNWSHSQPTDRLDPQDLTMRWAATSVQRTNTSSYANCEYTDLAHKQAQTGDSEKRRQLVYDAHEVFSKDVAQIQLFPNIQVQIWRSDEISVDDQYLSKAGFTYPNPAAFGNAEVNGGVIRAPMVTEGVKSTNHLTMNRHSYINFWGMFVNSCPLEWNQNYELENNIAKNVKVNEDATRYVLELDPNATFHNGDKVTADDVHWTYDFMQSTIGEFPHTAEWPVDSMKVVDDETFEITFTEPSPWFQGQTMTKWGILHSDSWKEAGAEDDPAVDPYRKLGEFIGSGPWQVKSFEPQSVLQLEPYSDHHARDVSNEIHIRAYRSPSSRATALEEGTLNLDQRLSPSFVEDLKSSMGDKITTGQKEPIVNFSWYPDFPRVPCRFEEIRKAVGAAVNRKEMVAVGMRGYSEPELLCCNLARANPYRPPEDRLYQYTDDPTGDIEKAKQILSEAGWGWDDNGNLHYPPDATLEPLWPKGSHPGDPNAFKDFPCVNEKNEWIPPEER